MAMIDGLTAEQCQALAGAVKGDLVLVKAYYKASNDESASISEDASENEEEENGEELDGEDHEEPSENGEDQEASDDGEDEEASDDDGDGGSSEDDEDSQHQADAPSLPEPTLFSIDQVVTDKSGSTTDIILYKLIYSANPHNVTSTSYQVYGKEIVVRINDPSDPTERGLASIRDVASNGGQLEYVLTLGPTGAEIYRSIFESRCPGGCSDGWLGCQNDLHIMVLDPVFTTTNHAPVCPVCMGKSLALEYNALRKTLEDFHMIDLEKAIDFYGRLNPRRRALGYSFIQFDEREWGYMFDDMIGEEEDGEDENAHRYEDWDEAMDPSNNVQTRPASADTIAALPRKKYAEAKLWSEITECSICKDDFKDEDIVIEVPCGHIFCEGCIAHWLAQFNSCPTCRAVVPAKITDTSASDTDGPSVPFDVQDRHPTGEEAGKDVIMSDAEDRVHA